MASEKHGGGGSYTGDSPTRLIKERLNIADMARRYLTLQRKGGNWFALCPFHQEKSPSFSINEEEGFFYCHGCHASGDIFDFYGRINGLEFRETLEQLAEEAGVSLEKSTSSQHNRQEQDIKKISLKMYELAKNHYKRNLETTSGTLCQEYITKRKISPEITESFELGYSTPEWHDLASVLRRSGFTEEQGIASGLLLKSEKGNVYDRFRERFMFPIKNLAGQCIAFGGRIIQNGDAAKYINSADSPLYKKGDNLYGLFQARRAISSVKSIILTEGYMDVLTLHQFGYLNSCGVLGTALTPEQVRRISGFCSDIELIFDGDNAGRKAALRSCEMILSKGLKCRVVLLPDGEDIDSLLHGHDKGAFEQLRKEAPDGLDFCIKVLRRDFAPKDSLDWVKQFLKDVEHQEFIPRLAAELCRGLDLDEQEIRRQLLYKANKGKNATNSQDEQFPSSQDQYDQYNQYDYDGQDFFDEDNTFQIADSQRHTRGKPSFERHLMIFLVRFPHHAKKLQSMGMEFILMQPRAWILWQKIMDSAPDFDPDNIIRVLNEQEKAFWVRYRTVDAPPPGNELVELEEVCGQIEKICREKQTKSTLQALRQTDGKSDLDLLKAIQERLIEQHKAENNHG